MCLPMYESLRIAVIIPAYREEARVVATIAGVPAWVDHIIAVDDASPDRTFEVLQGIADPRLVVLRHEQNQGVGGATLTGLKKALETGADVIVKMDADGQMDPARLPALLAPICRGEADYTKGNRFLHVRELPQMPLLRRIGNIGLSFLAKLASGYWQIFDPTNGYVAIHAALVPLLDEAHLDRRFFFESSMLIELGLHGAVVRDVYIPARYGDKVSSLSERKALLEFPPLLLRGFLRRIIIQYFVRDFNAVSLFLVAGLAATSFGALWGAYHWFITMRDWVPATTGTIMIAVLPVIVGVQFLLQALVLDIAAQPRHPVHLDKLNDGRPRFAPPASE